VSGTALIVLLSIDDPHHEAHEDHEAFGGFTAETLRTQRKEFLIKKYSDLCELRFFAVNNFIL
jgi:hypothetical protein